MQTTPEALTIAASQIVAAIIQADAQSYLRTGGKVRTDRIAELFQEICGALTGGCADSHHATTGTSPGPGPGA